MILDATFLAREARDQARALAARLGRALRRSCISRPGPTTLRARVRQRALRRDDASDADLAVLESQLAQAQPLQHDERNRSRSSNMPSSRWIARRRPGAGRRC